MYTKFSYLSVCVLTCFVEGENSYIICENCFSETANYNPILISIYTQAILWATPEDHLYKEIHLSIECN